MPLFAKLMYRALVWKERQRALASGGRRAAPQERPGHLILGERGETLAYWFLRQAGYIVVARNRRERAGELDMVGWDGPVLAFVEVKTRSSQEAGPPEAAVTRAQQKRIARAAREHMRKMKRHPAAYRFDIVSVFWEAPSGLQVRLTKDAFKG
jgi:putative endonuclease